MAVRRRRPAAKAGPAQTVRVHAIETLEAWQAALAKAEASRRVLVVQLYQVRGSGRAVVAGAVIGGLRASAASTHCRRRPEGITRFSRPDAGTQSLP